MSRMQLLQTPVALPGKCICCGAVDRPVVDLALNIKGIGRVYFCVTCITEAGSVVGLVPSSVYEDSKLVQQQFDAFLEEVVDINGAFRIALESATTHYSSRLDDLVSKSISEKPETIPLVSADLPGDNSAGSGERSSAAGKSSKSASVKGRSSVPTSNSDGFDFSLSK